VLGGNDGDVVGDNVPVHGTPTSSAKHDRNCNGREPSSVLNTALSPTVPKLACRPDGQSSGMKQMLPRLEWVKQPHCAGVRLTASASGMLR
jgi:hypothetical protein